MDMRVAAYAVIVEDDRILLARWTEGLRPAWTLPGGGLDPGEDPAAAARREVREETGLDAVIGELLGIHSRVIPAAKRVTAGAAAPLHTLRIVYRASVRGGTLRNEVGGSTDRAEWVRLDELDRRQRVSLVGIGLKMAGLR
ncbi:NUDIX hydrolase [Microbacterium limosum]|uniref:NUDIX hydrolase n=1 Tax=Microbacterium limosum TaxID=3079935 RepID=A0AAU0MGR2_9MICO|nr:NUDIX hydrolase [Microbacterium sp. Y20]WOQ69681.1 NUDIX hydrolase [Microbacterium sp. Y20]